MRVLVLMSWLSGQNETVSMESIEKICVTLDCNIGDIMEFVNDRVSYDYKPKTIELFAGAGG